MKLAHKQQYPKIKNDANTKSVKPFSKRLTLFWRLFLSLLTMLLVTSALSIGIERWLNDRHINNRMQAHVAHLITARQEIAHLIEHGDMRAIRQRYRKDRELMAQIRLINAQGDVIFPRFRQRRNANSPDIKGRDGNSRDDIFINQKQPPYNLPQPTPPPANHPPSPSRDDLNNLAWQQLSISEDAYPELTDMTVYAPNGQHYTLQLQPRLPLHEVMTLRRSYTLIRLGLIVLFSILVCYWLSRTLTRRIRKVQYAVHHISEGSYQNDDDLTELGDDELGMLAKDVANLSTRLAESENARRRMLSDISHELRSPLARLDIATELSRDFAPQATRYLERIEKESRRMNHLIDQIIHIQSLQMIGYASNAENSEIVDIVALLESIKEDVCFEFQNKQVSWQWDAPTPLDNTTQTDTNPYTVFGNYEQLYSAFENIIRNAFEHTATESMVTVALTQTAINPQTSAVKIDITDNGAGIDDPVDLERIFQPFVRLSTSRSRPAGNQSNMTFNSEKSTGYGLGLAISHAIIKAHHGQISAHHRDDGENGLTIRVMLPCFNQ